MGLRVKNIPKTGKCEVRVVGRPSKNVDVLEEEQKSHRTKGELCARKAAEEALATGEKLKERKETKENPIAHREFLRVNKLLIAIGKNDALHEPIINRYCMLQAESADFEKKREMFSENLQAVMADPDMEPDQKYRLEAQMQKSILDVDKQVQAKRKMMFDIEKECAMTISAAMRSIPKTTASKENPLLEALRDGSD